jgi:hypothetical protein
MRQSGVWRFSGDNVVGEVEPFADQAGEWPSWRTVDDAAAFSAGVGESGVNVRSSVHW